jgi:drug/metabolite transporter (DMT)-like permease
MSTLPEGQNCASNDTPQVQPFLYLAGVVILLSTVPTVTKFVFQHSDVNPLGMACIRVGIGFVFLAVVTALRDRRGVMALTAWDLCLLTFLGWLGVGSYVIAAWGIQHTKVTHYILIYSLLSPFTSLLSVVLGKSRMSRLKIIGILMALFGCVSAVSQKGLDLGIGFGFGDLLILLFTVMMAFHIVMSVGVVKRLGALIAHTVMFGSSAIMLIMAALVLGEPLHVEPSLSMSASLIYIGGATATVFLLRSLALQTLAPVTVAVCHNLVPVTAILFAHLYIGESIGGGTFVGGAAILAGVELVRRGENAPPHASRLDTKPIVSGSISSLLPK